MEVDSAASIWGAFAAGSHSVRRAGTTGYVAWYRVSSLHIAWTLLMRVDRSNPSFINRDARVQEHVVEGEGEGKDVENGPQKNEIEEVPRVVGDTVYMPSLPRSMYTSLCRVSDRRAEDLDWEHRSSPELQIVDASGVV